MSDQPLPPAQPSSINTVIHQRAIEMATRPDAIPRIERFITLAEFGKKSSLEGIIPIPFERSDWREKHPIIKQDFDKLNFQLNQACEDPNSFLVATPEYVLYAPPTVSTPIQLGNENQLVAGQPEVVDFISQTQSLAKAKRVTFVLSSICEQVILSSGKPVTYSTTFIIDPEGNISPRRKICTDIFAFDGNQWRQATEPVRNYLTKDNPIKSSVLTQMEIAEAAELALQTIKPKQITDKKGKTYTMSTLICEEITSKKFLNNVLPHVSPETDLVVVPISEGEKPKELYEEHGVMESDVHTIHIFLENILGKKEVIYVLDNETMGMGAVVKYDNNGQVTEVAIKK